MEWLVNAIASISTAVANEAAGAASQWCQFQPKEPEELRK